MNKAEWLASRCPNQSQDTLWCCHVRAVDDMYAAGSKEEAEAWARWVNATDPDFDFQAEAAPWPWSAEAHADDLPSSRETFGGVR